MTSWLLFAALVAMATYLFYKWTTSTFDFFTERGIPFEKPVPLFGNFAGIIFRKESLFDKLIQLHRKFDSKVYGLFEMRQPIIIVKDPELIKQITVKDFDSFMNHRSMVEAQDDLLIGNSLKTLKDQKWKNMRSTLSPAFTGSKIRLMYQLVRECCDNAVAYLNAEAKKSKTGIADIDMKELCTRFANDVIASTAFGLQVDSLKDKENDFYEKGRQLTNFDSWTRIKLLLFGNIRPVMRFLKVQLFNTELSSFFHNLVIDTMKQREKHSIVRPDMINLLMEAVKTREWTEHELTAQCFLFFIAGLEPVSTLVCFAAYELMECSEIQKDLRDEVDAVNRELNGKPLTYEILQGMKYMDMIISETLRKWPPGFQADRVCTKEYTYVADDGEEITFKPGDLVYLPILGMHYDHELYPKPHVFDPDRFSDENRANITPYTYAPFGFGPRICIGTRLAIMEAKAILFHLLENFVIGAAPTTKIPIKISTAGFQLTPESGFPLSFRPRTTPTSS